MNSCAFTNNSSNGDSYLAGAIGGEFSGTLTVENSTFVGNSASAPDAYAGVISVVFGTADVDNSTFSGNSGSGLYSSAGILLVDSGTVLNAANNLFGVNNGAACLDYSGSCASNGSNGNFYGDAKLLPLGWYGGQTESFLPLPGSPAICAGSAANAVDANNNPLTIDQRGYAMNPYYATCASGVDAGAVQSNYIQVQSGGMGGPCPSAGCTLDGALNFTNSSGGDDGQNVAADIDFAPCIHTVTLSNSLQVNRNGIAIVGPGANQLTINGGGPGSDFSVFTISSNSQALLYGLTVSQGNTKSSSGGGINNAGALTVIAGAISGNAAANSNAGGGIANTGTLSLIDSTVSGNSAQNNGGGILDTGTVTLTGSTVYGNTASGLEVFGGGIFSGGPLAMANSTVTGNTASTTQAAAVGGGIYINGGGQLTLANSIVAGNVTTFSVPAFGGSADIAGNYTDNGGNLADNNSSATSPYAGTLNLSPLQYNGIGATVQTLIPLPGSPALCARTTANIPSGTTTDERGYPLSTPGYCLSGQVDSGAVQTNYTSVAFAQQPTGAIVNTAMSPDPTAEVLETDTLLSGSNTDGVAGIPITLTYSDGASQISGTLTETAGANGIADFSGLTPTTIASGAYFSTSVTVNSGTTLTADSDTFEVFGPVSQLVFTSAPAVTVTAGCNAGSSIQVAEEMSGGTTVTLASDTITLSVSGPGGYTASYTQVATSGIATFNLGGVPLTVAGGYTYTASISGSSSVAAAQASETVSAASAAVISSVSGSGQKTALGAAFGNALKVNVQDAHGNAISGASVLFAAPASGASAALSNNGAATTDSNGNASIIATANALAGSYSVSATVSGVTAPASFTLTNQQATAAVALQSSANPTMAQNAVTLTAKVTSSAGTPTGSVTFYNGTTALSSAVALSGGTATLITSSLSVGTDSITVAYSGDANFASSTSSAVTETVEDFSLAISGSGSGTSLTVTPGQTATYNLVVSPVAPATNFPAAINLAVSGLPGGMNYTVSPQSLSAGSGSTPLTLTITTSAMVANHGAPQVTPLGRRMAPLALALLLLPFARRMRQTGKKLGRMLAVLLLLAAGAAAITGISGCGASGGFSGQTPQTYTVTLTGTSGTLSHSTTVSLTVE